MTESERSDLYRLIVEQLGDAIVYSDAQGIIRGWNKAAEALFGYAKEEAIGQSLDLIIPERLRAAHWAGFERAMESGRTRLAGRAQPPPARRRGGGDALYVEMSFAVIADEQGKAVGSAAMARDVTERHLAQRNAKGLAAAKATKDDSIADPEPALAEIGPASSELDSRLLLIRRREV